MDEWSFILKVRVFAHSNGDEVVDKITQVLLESGLGHWEFTDITKEFTKSTGQSTRQQGGGKKREDRKKDVPENRVYV